MTNTPIFAKAVLPLLVQQYYFRAILVATLKYIAKFSLCQITTNLGNTCGTWIQTVRHTLYIS